MQASVPRRIIVSSANSPEYTLMPYVTREAPPWMFTALPVYGLSRLQSMEQALDGSWKEKSFGKHSGNVQDDLMKNFSPGQPVHLKAS